MKWILWGLAVLLVAVYMLGPFFGWATNRDYIRYAIWIVLVIVVFGMLRDRFRTPDR